MKKVASMTAGVMAMLILLCGIMPMTGCTAKTVKSPVSLLDGWDWTAIQSKDLKEAIEKIPTYYADLFSSESVEKLNEVLREIKDAEEMTKEEERQLRERLIAAIAGLKADANQPARVSITCQTEIDDLKTEGYSEAEVAVLWNDNGADYLVEESRVRIKLHGNSTATAKKKSVTLKFEEKQDIFGFGEAKTWFLISNSFDKSLLRNKLTYDFAREIGLPGSVECEFCEVWYNGTFLGLYLLTEKVESGSERLDIQPENDDCLIEFELTRRESGVTYIKTSGGGLRFGIIEPKLPTGTQITEIRDSLDSLESAIASGDQTRFEELADLSSFVDYYIMIELFKNLDIEFSSTKFFRKDGKWYAGPVWDYDLSMGNAIVNSEPKYRTYNNAVVDGEIYGDGSGDSTRAFWGQVLFFKGLLTTEWFLPLVKARYAELQPRIVNLYRENELGKSRMDILLDTYGEAIDRNYEAAGWSLSRELVDRRTDGTYADSRDYLRSWLEKRNDWLLSALNSD